MIKTEKELELINDLSIDSLNLCRLLIRESVKLKLNMNTKYQSRISNYCMKQYKIFKYVKNMKCSSMGDFKLRRYLLKIARSYDKVLYTKYLVL